MNNNNMNPSPLFQNYTWNNTIINHHHNIKNDDDHHHHNDPIGMVMDQHTHLSIFNPFTSSSSSSSSTHHFPPPLSSSLTLYSGDQEDEEEEEEEPLEELGAMKEMMYKIAAMQPVDIDPATVKKPKRRNVRISDDPQSVAARHRRERISERMRILQRLVPGGTKLDSASMLDEAIRYVKFLKRQIRLLNNPPPPAQDQATRAVTASIWVPPPPPPPSNFNGLRGGGGELI